MSEMIKVGDLVMLVRQHCGMEANGEVATVTHFDNQAAFCHVCRTELGRMTIAHTDGRIRAPSSWLKRIPPLEELDKVKRDEVIHA